MSSVSLSVPSTSKHRALMRGMLRDMSIILPRECLFFGCAILYLLSLPRGIICTGNGLKHLCRDLCHYRTKQTEPKPCSNFYIMSVAMLPLRLICVLFFNASCMKPFKMWVVSVAV